MQARWLFITLALMVAAALCNPVGPEIIETVARPLFSAANPYISEWQPVTITWGFLLYGLFVVLFVVLFVALFVALVIGRPTCATPAEKWLAYGFLVYGLTASRVLTTFTIIAAPMLAVRLAPYFRQRPTSTASAQAIRNWTAAQLTRRRTLMLSVFAATAVTFTAPSQAFLRHFPQQVNWPDFKEEIAYLGAHYPHGRFIIDFQIGGYFIYETRGAIPIFADARTETAFPREVMEDYLAFYKGSKGWEHILDKYAIDGIVISNSSGALHDRFDHRKGWKKTFTGANATIFVRVKPSSAL